MSNYAANQCHHCGRFCKYEDLDSYTPYGCSNYDYPEPFDPTNVCKSCSNILYEKFKEQFRRGNYKYGHWQKSNAEIQAAIDSELVWIGNDSSIVWMGQRMFNEYMPKSEYDKIVNKPTQY